MSSNPDKLRKVVHIFTWSFLNIWYISIIFANETFDLLFCSICIWTLNGFHTGIETFWGRSKMDGPTGLKWTFPDYRPIWRNYMYVLKDHVLSSKKAVYLHPNRSSRFLLFGQETLVQKSFWPSRLSFAHRSFFLGPSTLDVAFLVADENHPWFWFSFITLIFSSCDSSSLPSMSSRDISSFFFASSIATFAFSTVSR